MARRSRQNAVQDAVQDNVQLDKRLSDYSAVTRVSAAANGQHRRVGNWPIYAAAAGSALAMATSASASIIYSGPESISVTAPGGLNTALQPVDLDGAPSNHILDLVAGSGKFPLASTLFGTASLRGVGTLNHPLRIQIFDTGSLAKNFAKSAKISAGAGSLKIEGKVVQGFMTGSVVGKFSAGNSGFAGLALQTSNGNQTDYGWIQLIFENGNNGLPATLTAKGWAIEEDGDPILAGQTTDPPAVPEPGTMALGLLASGAAGVMILRRRRKHIARP